MFHITPTLPSRTVPLRGTIFENPRVSVAQSSRSSACPLATSPTNYQVHRPAAGMTLSKVIQSACIVIRLRLGEGEKCHTLCAAASHQNLLGLVQVPSHSLNSLRSHHAALSAGHLLKPTISICLIPTTSINCVLLSGLSGSVLVHCTRAPSSRTHYLRFTFSSLRLL